MLSFNHQETLFNVFLKLLQLKSPGEYNSNSSESESESNQSNHLFTQSAKPKGVIKKAA